MKVDTLFLTIDEDQPLGIFWATDNGAGVFDFDEFLSESLIDLSEEQSSRYIERLQKFILELKQ